MANGDPPEAPDSSVPSSPRELKLVSNSQSAPGPAPGPASGSPSASGPTPESLPPSSSTSKSESPAAAPSSARPTKDADDDDASRRGLPIWLFVVFFVGAALAIGWQFRLTGQLEQEIAGLESELDATTALLGAHQSRLVEIRGGVRDLASQLEGLQALVDAEPADSLSSAQSSREASAASSREASAASSRAQAREIPARLPR